MKKGVVAEKLKRRTLTLELKFEAVKLVTVSIECAQRTRIVA